MVAFSNLKGLIVTEVEVEGNSASIKFGDKILLLQGCPYNDSRCDLCSCDKEKFRVTLVDDGPI